MVKIIINHVNWMPILKFLSLLHFLCISLNIFHFIIRNGIGQKLYNIMIALSLLRCICAKKFSSIS